MTDRKCYTLPDRVESDLLGERPDASDLACLFRALKADLVFMLQAYIDESGTDEASAFTCVAGYLLDSDQCLMLDAEWRELIESYGIRCFHMADCAHGVKEFRGMAKSDRAELARRCIGIIKRRVRMGMMVSISQSDFRSIRTDNGIHDAYVLCLLWCIAGMANWGARYEPNKKIAYFFERGARLQARANAAMEWEHAQPWSDKHYYSHSFISKTDAMAIQSADLLAWEWQRELNNKFGIPRRRPRRLSFRSLLERTHLYCHLSREHAMALIAGRSDSALLQFHALDPGDRNFMVVRRQSVPQ